MNFILNVLRAGVKCRCIPLLLDIRKCITFFVIVVLRENRENEMVVSDIYSHAIYVVHLLAWKKRSTSLFLLGFL